MLLRRAAGIFGCPALATVVGGVFAGLLPSVCPPAWGQCPPEWVQRFDVPAARYRPAMAYDSQREVVVMFGGDGDGANDDAFRQLWE
jgi:hypothetical protein